MTLQLSSSYLFTPEFNFGTSILCLLDASWLDTIRKFVPFGRYRQYRDCIFLQESERVVTKKEGIDFAREYGCLFLECSAKTRVNVEQCFEELVLKVPNTLALFSFLPFLRKRNYILCGLWLYELVWGFGFNSTISLSPKFLFFISEQVIFLVSKIL